MKWFLLICIFVIIGAGCILLGIDYDNLSDAWQGLAGSFTCFVAAGWMTWYFAARMMTLEDIAQRLDRLETLTALSAKTVLDINDTAELTGYSVKYLLLLIAKREIPHYRRGNRLYFSRDEIEDWMMGTRIPIKEEINIKAMGYRPS